MNTKRITTLAGLGMLTLVGSQGLAGDGSSSERDMQFINILGRAGNVFVVNTGGESFSLDGWRLSTQNSTSGIVHSAPDAFDGVVIPPHGSFLIFFDDNARDDIATHFNASDVGPIAPFEMDAYAMSLYAPSGLGEVDFANGEQMVDHVQWSRYILELDFANQMETQSIDAAVSAGLWADASETIAVREATYIIELTDRDFEQMHSPSDYNVLFDCRPDLSDDGELNFFDISMFIDAFASQDPMADVSRDGNFNFFDVSLYIQSLGAGCPF